MMNPTASAMASMLATTCDKSLQSWLPYAVVPIVLLDVVLARLVGEHPQAPLGGVPPLQNLQHALRHWNLPAGIALGVLNIDPAVFEVDLLPR